MPARAISACPDHQCQQGHAAAAQQARWPGSYAKVCSHGLKFTPGPIGGLESGQVQGLESGQVQAQDQSQLITVAVVRSRKERQPRSRQDGGTAGGLARTGQARTGPE